MVLSSVRALAAGVLAIAMVVPVLPEYVASTGTGPPVREPARSITLITGDRIVVHGTQVSRLALDVQPAAGRERVTFIRQVVGGDLYLVPADAQPLVAAGKLDRRLFNVTALLRDGYGSRPDLPLVVRLPEGRSTAGTRAALAAAGARLGDDLPSIGAVAVRRPRSDAGKLWRRLRADLDRGSSRARIWLDGRVRASLDQSVPHIGAPAAWQAGLTGEGVRIAVLDTGYDAGHPDLRPAVAERSFVEGEPTAQDLNGHGTHVASTIVGSGAASGGRYRGVAPDAELLVGKVLDQTGGGLESQIVAGMEWAVANRARVVNLSLGGTDSIGVDPLEAAVERLTAQHGTLFVVAAGNSGRAETIGSPGSAKSALTVGSFTKQDELSTFSSQGPVAEDSGLKPDIMAPGEDIVAAWAAGTQPLGEPVGEHYVRMSGTSMATPHVAGAAALLGQQHPDWNAGELTAALTSSAQPHKELTAYQQGAGRVDIARAISQQIHPEPSGLSMGHARWPGYEPVQRTLTYRNDGPAPVALDLTVGATTQDGEPAPAGLFTVDSRQVTVPAHGQSTVTVTADAGTAALGLYGGRLTARSPDGRVVVQTPMGVFKEPESYEQSIAVTDRAGEPADGTTVSLVDLATGKDFLVYVANGHGAVRLPKGRYLVSTVIVTPHGPGDADDEFTIAVRPAVQLDRAGGLTFDARRGVPIRVQTERPANGMWGEAGWYSGPYSEVVFGTSVEGMSAIPTSQTEGFAFYTQATLRGPDATDHYGYNVVFPEPGRIPSRLTYQPRDAELARVRTTYASTTDNEMACSAALPVPPGIPELGERDLILVLFMACSHAEGPLPVTRTEYVTPDPVRWGRVLLCYDPAQPDTATLQIGPLPRLRAGKDHNDLRNAAVFGPSVDSGQVGRLGDQIRLDLPLYADAGRLRYTLAPGSGRTRLLKDGQLIGSHDTAGAGTFGVPEETARYRLETEGTRTTNFSSQVKAAWTFRSGHVSGEQEKALPLLAVRFEPRLDAHNRAPSGETFSVPFRVERTAGATASLRKLSVAVSYDDGRTWQPVQVERQRDSGIAVVRHPDAAASVSLRATAADLHGNTLEQTIIRAYSLHT